MPLCSIGSIGSVGVVLGAIAVFALAKRLLFRRLWRGSRHGRRTRELRCGGAARRWGRRGLGRSFWLRALFSELDTTPGQEREIRAALEDLRTTAREARGGLFGARTEIARAVGGEAFDEAAFTAATTRADDAAGRMKEALRTALERVHAILDPKQRERLAELLGRGAWFGRGGGPYRTSEA